MSVASLAVVSRQSEVSRQTKKQQLCSLVRQCEMTGNKEVKKVSFSELTYYMTQDTSRFLGTEIVRKGNRKTCKSLFIMVDRNYKYKVVYETIVVM